MAPIRKLLLVTAERTNLVWLAVCLAFLQLIQISLISSLILLATISILVQSGHILLQWAGFRQMGLGARFILAGGVFAVCSQLLLALGASSSLTYPITSALFLTFSAIGTIKKPKGNRRSNSNGFNELRTVTGITILIFSIRHPWALSFGIPIALMAYNFPKRFRSSSSNCFLGVLALSGLVFAHLLRPNLWWYSYYTTTDAGFFESLSWIGSEWGVSTSPGMIGSWISSYHWLSYVLFGGLSHVAALPPWDGLMKLGVPILTGLFISLISHSPFRSEPRKSEGLSWALAMLAATSWPFYRVDSASFGLLAGLVLVGLVIRQQALALQGFKPMLLIGMATVFTMLSKAPVAVIAGAIVVFASALSPSRLSIRAWHGPTTFAIASGSTYLLLFHGGAASERLFSAKQVGNIVQYIFDSLTSLPSTPLLLTLLFVVNHLYRSGHLENDSRTGLIFTVAASCLAILSGLLHLVLTNSAQFFIPSGFYLFVFTVWYVIDRDSSSLSLPTITRPRIFTGVFATSVVVGFALPVIANRINNAFGVEAAIGSSAWEAFRKLTIFVPIWMVLGYVLRKGPVATKQLVIGLTVTLSLGIAIGTQLDGARRVLLYGPSVYNSSPSNDAAFPSPDLRNIGTYIRLNTDKGFVLATNDFCCFGEEWWNYSINGIKEGRTYGNKLRWGGDNHLLAAESRRRVFIQGLAFQLGGRLPSAEQVRRMSLSLEFANRPTQSSLDELKGSGVDGFVVNLSLTNHRDWTSFAVERYRNEGYVFFELR